MKNAIKILGYRPLVCVTLAVMISFGMMSLSLTSCDNPTDSTGGGDKTLSGDLTVSPTSAAANTELTAT